MHAHKRERFWVSQDERHTVQPGLRHQIVPRVWVAGGADHGSGLPFEFEGIQPVATAQFGQALADRLNFGRGRVKPNPSFDASAGADFVEDGQIRCGFKLMQSTSTTSSISYFAALFSGTAIEPPRSYALRLTNTF